MIPLCKLKSNQLRQLWPSQSDSHHWRYYHCQAFRNNYKCLPWFVKKAKVKFKSLVAHLHYCKTYKNRNYWKIGQHFGAFKCLPRLPENIEKMAKSYKMAGAHLHYISYMMIPLCKVKSNRLRQLWLSQSDSHRWRYYHRQAFRNNYKYLLWFVKKAMSQI